MLLTLRTTHGPATDLGYPAAQAPGPVPDVRPELRQGARLLPGGRRERCTAACCSTSTRWGWSGARAAAEPARPVRQRPALRRLVVPERGDRAGLRLGPRRPLQGRGRSWRRRRSRWRRGSTCSRAAAARAFLRRPVRAARLRGRGRSRTRSTSVPRVGREPVLLRDPARHAAGSSDLLTHLYVLVPVFDDDKHYWVGDDEVEKLLRHGEGWLARTRRGRRSPAATSSTSRAGPGGPRPAGGRGGGPARGDGAACATPRRRPWRGR